MKKKILLYVACVAALICFTVAFLPDQVFQRKMIGSPDYENYAGGAHEVIDWDWKHPKDKALWTGKMFSGMPTTMLSRNTKNNAIWPLFKALDNGENRPASTLVLSLFGAFMLMLVVGVRPWIAVFGAIAITFCSYNPQIIQAGHNTKMLALAFSSWVLAALLFTYKKALSEPDSKRWFPFVLLGSVLFGLFLAFQIEANHVQITWYLALIVFCYLVGLVIWLCSSKERFRSLWKRFAIASATIFVFGMVGIATNAGDLLPNWEYTSETTRGGSDLSGQNEKGLSIDYATKWSYGWEELPNLMIPNFNGGATAGPLSQKSNVAKLLKMASNYQGSIKRQPLYWGPQPSTSGPMYMGAITIFLFLLGLLICDGKDKWWMLVAVLLAIGLALGNHLMPLTKLFRDVVPFYNKFRALSMSLVILQFLLPLLGFIALEKVLKGEIDKNTFKKKGLIAFCFTGGLCLLFALLPGLAGSFSGPVDQSLPDSYVQALMLDRKALLRTDAFISFLLIGATYLSLLLSYNYKEKGKTVAAVVVCALLAVNLFAVGKRYLNSNHFTKWKEFIGVFNERPVDSIILQDKNISYRVADLSVNLFADAKASFLHKSIGGYSAAKLRRYHELIERYLTPEVIHTKNVITSCSSFEEFNARIDSIPALSMLNTKYFIASANSGPLTNPHAMGNAWFVEGAEIADTPDKELELVGKVNLSRKVILGPDFKDVAIPPGRGAEDYIELTSYTPNELTYKYFAAKPRAVVFSEIYYPHGWKARLDDGTPLELFRADWTLRGAVVPAGIHEIVMRMDPRSYKVGSGISLVTSIFIYLMLAAAICWLFLAKKEK